MAEIVNVAYVSFTDAEGTPTYHGIKGCLIERVGRGDYQITLDRAIDSAHADYLIAGFGGRFAIADNSPTVKRLSCYENTSGQLKNNFSVRVLLGLVYTG